MPKPKPYYDVIIAGGGPIGLAFARSLATLPLNIAVIEKNDEATLARPPVDGRDIALTHLSVNILKKLGVWSSLSEKEISPIKKAKVFDGNSSYALEFTPKKSGTLAHLVPHHLLRRILFKNRPKNVDLITETAVTKVTIADNRAHVHLSNDHTIQASLLVAADGRFSKMRDRLGISATSKDCGQVAIVARMTHEKSHHQTASECFLYGGTLAILPINGNFCSVVITVAPDKGKMLLEMDKNAFSDYVKTRFQHRLGNMKLSGKRHTYPLIVTHARHYIAARSALIGDAVVGMHPVTAHGFNLGLQGQDTLARNINDALRLGLDIGTDTTLKPYETTHREAVLPMFLSTNAIIQLYTNDHRLARPLRTTLLRTANSFPFVRDGITAQLMEVSDV